jgi:hypothetical protein
MFEALLRFGRIRALGFLFRLFIFYALLTNFQRSRCNGLETKR